ncbi:MAG: CPBP family glutamic-type intramembrane protease [Nitrospiraceae bacterium]
MSRDRRAECVTPREQSLDPEPERLAWLALMPAFTTGLYYALPPRLQTLPAILFLPQVLAYLGLAIWASQNTAIPKRLGLGLHQLGQGLQWGLGIGLILGLLNVSVILWLVPLVGGDIYFLRDTPHARLPVALMLPWGILLIAILVELNFRGFLLGRLLSLCQSSWLRKHPAVGPALASMLAIAGASTVFAFDPFMVATFKHLHWIAIWDGIIWGAIWVRFRNLYAPIVAHTVEVMIMYSILKLAL